MLLDDGLDDKNRELAFKFNNGITIIILWIGITLSYLNGLLFNIDFLIAAVSLIVCTIAVVLKVKLGVKITLGIIILAIISLIDFFPFGISFGFKAGDRNIGIDLWMAAIGVIHVVTNRALFGLVEKEPLPPLSEEEIQSAFRRKVEGFKQHFQSKSPDQLIRLAANERLAPEAIQAANELLRKLNEEE